MPKGCGTPWSRTIIRRSFKNVCSKMGVQIHFSFKGSNIFKNLLVAPKDRDNIPQKSGVIYRLKYDKVDCEEEYIGSQQRLLGKG